MDSAKQIELDTAAWLTKRDSGEWTENDQAQLDAWLEASTAHRIAHLRLSMVWEESHRLKAFAAALPPGSGEKNNWTIPLFDQRPVPAEKPRKARIFALAAGVLVIIGAGAFLAASIFNRNSYTTPVGGITSVPLRDGSSITLNTDSKIRVEWSDTERRIDLAQGEAFFDVAKDPARPFTVMAGNKRIVAVGTQFSVRRDRDDVRVVVTEGAVRLLSSDEKSSLLAAGTIARTREGAVLVQTTTLPKAEATLSWRIGYLTFNDTPLAEAIAEFNQYNEQKISTADPALAGIPLTGKFKATNYDAFVRLLEDGYSIQANRAGGTIMLTRSGNISTPTQ